MTWTRSLNTLHAIPWIGPHFFARLLEATDRLAEFPDSGRIIPEINDSSCREIPVAAYRIMYRVESNQVWITGIVHGARNWKSEQKGVTRRDSTSFRRARKLVVQYRGTTLLILLSYLTLLRRISASPPRTTSISVAGSGTASVTVKTIWFASMSYDQSPLQPGVQLIS